MQGKGPSEADVVGAPVPINAITKDLIIRVVFTQLIEDGVSSFLIDSAASCNLMRVQRPLNWVHRQRIRAFSVVCAARGPPQPGGVHREWIRAFAVLCAARGAPQPQWVHRERIRAFSVVCAARGARGPSKHEVADKPASPKT